MLEDLREGKTSILQIWMRRDYTVYIKETLNTFHQAFWWATISSLSHQLWLWVVSQCTTGDQGRKEQSPPSWAGTQVNLHFVNLLNCAPQDYLLTYLLKFTFYNHALLNLQFIVYLATNFHSSWLVTLFNFSVVSPGFRQWCLVPSLCSMLTV